MNPLRTAKIKYIRGDLGVGDFHDAVWETAEAVHVTQYWSGKEAPQTRYTEVRMLWSAVALYVRFDAVLGEPLWVFEDAHLTRKRIGLWERDVGEIFIAPDHTDPRRYFEFQVAPTSEWLDLVVDWSRDEPRDWSFRSNMQTSVKLERASVAMAIKIPWEAFGKNPNDGDIWLGNLFRCVGKEPDRGYLAWQPTYTAEQNFHVPEKFGEFLFVG